MQSHSNAEAAIGALGLFIFVVVFLGLYVFYSYCCKRICEKTGRNPGILIWIPIVQIVPLLEVAGMATWMLVLMFIPIVNFVVLIMMWVKICQARGKHPALVLMVFVPIANLVFIPYLAFSE